MSAMGVVRKAAKGAKRADSPASGSRTGDFIDGFVDQIAAAGRVFTAGSAASIWGVLGTFAAFDVFLMFIGSDSAFIMPAIRTVEGVVM